MSDNGLQEYSNRWNKPLRPNCEIFVNGPKSLRQQREELAERFADPQATLDGAVDEIADLL